MSVRCFSCGEVLDHLRDTFWKILNEHPEKTPLDVFENDLKIPPSRYCCRGNLISSVDINEKWLKNHTRYVMLQDLRRYGTLAFQPKTDWEDCPAEKKVQFFFDSKK